MPKVAREQPLAELTLRKYEKPYDLHGRDLMKKICLSLGLLQPGDSRDVIVDILGVLIASKESLDSVEVERRVKESRKKALVQVHGVAPSNIRRQLKRLRDLYLVEKLGNQYRIAENAKLIDLFEEKIEKFYLKTIIERVKEYLRAIP
ncbi:hypothetical protein HY493_05590 [Candidatus Woesearchaeota archaeon]|nr:hypothetical protein [Candidatus Woesearchaeota archaeon]